MTVVRVKFSNCPQLVTLIVVDGKFLSSKELVSTFMPKRVSGCSSQVLTADNPAMFDDWPQLSSLLARALPTANVNFLYPEAEDAGEYSI